MKKRYMGLFFLVSILSCQVDHGLSPPRSGVTGVIIFRGAWPAEPEEVRLVSSRRFPPAGIGEIDLGESIPLDADTFAYVYYLDPGTYAFLGVLWREKGGTWDLASVCGIYFAGTDSLTPGHLRIPTDTTWIRGIDLRVDRDRARRMTPTRIVGSVTFEGSWPPDVSEARVMATTRFSLSPLRLPSLFDICFGDRITPGTRAVTYTIPSFPGRFVATAVVFFHRGRTFTVEDLLYAAQVGGLSLQTYEVIEGDTVRGPDFVIRF